MPINNHLSTLAAVDLIADEQYHHRGLYLLVGAMVAGQDIGSLYTVCYIDLLRTAAEQINRAGGDLYPLLYQQLGTRW
jgi:hypothetical protein